MAFDRHLFIEDLLGVNGQIAQSSALQEISIFIDRDFKSTREYELEAAYEALCRDFESVEDSNAKLFVQVLELQKQLGGSKLEKMEKFDFGVLDTSENNAYAEM